MQIEIDDKAILASAKRAAMKIAQTAAEEIDEGGDTFDKVSEFINDRIEAVLQEIKPEIDSILKAKALEAAGQANVYISAEW